MAQLLQVLARQGASGSTPAATRRQVPPIGMPRSTPESPSDFPSQEPGLRPCPMARGSGGSAGRGCGCAAAQDGEVAAWLRDWPRGGQGELRGDGQGEGRWQAGVPSLEVPTRTRFPTLEVGNLRFPGHGPVRNAMAFGAPSGAGAYGCGDSRSRLGAGWATEGSAGGGSRSEV